MNYVAEAENILKRYRLMSAAIYNLKGEMTHIERKMIPSGKMTATLSESGCRGGSSGNTANDVFKYAEIKAMLDETQEGLDRIDQVLNQINLENAMYGPLLKYWYIDRLSKDQIMSKLKYRSQGGLYENKQKAIEAFAIAFYGIRAAKSL